MNVFWPLTTGISLLGNMVGMAIRAMERNQVLCSG